MNTAAEKFSVMGLDGTVVPVMQPITGNLDVADLLQWAGKPRHFSGGAEVEIPESVDAPADSVYVVVMRRRRR